MKKLLAFLAAISPAKLKRFIYMQFFGYSIHPSAYIGCSFIYCDNLIMAENSRIGHLTVIKGLKIVELGCYSRLGNLNWVTAFPLNTKSEHFSKDISRNPALYIGDHSAITNRHLIDCTNTVSIGKFSTFAGFRNQILTHSISIEDSEQRSSPVQIGDYCFVGTGTIILPGSGLPSYSVLGAGSVLNKLHIENYFLYAGAPARPIKELKKSATYFNRPHGFVI